MVRKVLRTKYEAICIHCGLAFELNDDLMRDKEIRDGFVPFKAKSSNTSIHCPNCSCNNYRINFIYKNLYRIRCQKCGKMFDSENTYSTYCPTCFREHVRNWAMLGGA